ncbi:MAG: methylglyoxal synthase [Eubacteriales bacterium]
MEIELIANDSKKELMVQFCIAYCGILAKHRICAPKSTGSMISEATGLRIEQLLPGGQGGMQQLISRISFNEIDVLIYFRDGVHKDIEHTMRDESLIRECDLNNVPLATNIGTAEIIINALERGDLDWRELVNPNSEYNRKKHA